MTQSTPNLDRRTFLQAGAAGLAAASLVTSAHAAQDKSPGGIPLRPLGRTGEKVTMIGLGGFHAAVPEPESDSLRLIQRAIDEGITFLDNAWDYPARPSRNRMTARVNDERRNFGASYNFRVHQALGNLRTPRRFWTLVEQRGRAANA